LEDTRVEEKRFPFQIMIRPPEAPTEGANSKRFKNLGQNFLR
jgi:hypothetical protein